MNKQSGNVLIYILIAIFLLGGLTVLMSRTSGQSEDTGNAEQRSIQVSEFLKYAAGLQSAVQALLMKGCSEQEISFEAVGTSQSTGYHNANSPTDKSCHVFEPEGAGLTWIDFYNKFPDFVRSYNVIVGRTGIQDIGTTCLAASCSELYLFVRMYHAEAFCREISRRANITVVWPVHGISSGPLYTGTYTGGDTPLGDATNGPEYAGKKTGCYEDTETYTDGTPYYDFYQVLIAR